MAQEKVEIARGLHEAWNDQRMDDFRELLDPDVVILRFIEGWPEPGPVVGREAVMRHFEAQRTWDQDTAEPISDFAHSGNRVAVRFRWRALTRGPEVSMEVTAIYTIRDRRIAVIEYVREHAEALEALGLSDSGS